MVADFSCTVNELSAIFIILSHQEADKATV